MGVKELFAKMDKDESNSIDCYELRIALGQDNVSQHLIDTLFKMYDKNGDGKLDRKEFSKFCKENKIYTDLCIEGSK